jgi:hypothetical protein
MIQQQATKKIVILAFCLGWLSSIALGDVVSSSQVFEQPSSRAIPKSLIATAQEADVLFYQGKEYALLSNPLESYYGRGIERPEFQSPHTANWRGYVATWEIDNGVLYLKAIKAWIDNKEVGLDYLFPNHQGRVKATWFSDKLRVPQGKLLDYVHLGYGSIYEKDLIISFWNGKVIRQEIIDNKNRVSNNRRR